MTTWHNKLNAELAGRVSALEMAIDGLILAYGSDDEARELNEILQILRRGAAGGGTTRISRGQAADPRADTQHYPAKAASTRVIP